MVIAGDDGPVRRGFRQVRWLAVLGLIAAMAWAQPPADPDAAMLDGLRAGDARVAAIAYRLATANVGLCDRRRLLSGLIVHDASQYHPALRALAMQRFGLDDRPGVELVVADGPAARAGVRAGDAILSIDGVATPVHPSPSVPARADDATAERVEALLSDALARGPATLVLRRDGRERSVRVVPVDGCAGDVRLQPGDRFDAWGDGRDIVVTTRVLAFVQGDDELAAVIAHEMAHVILGHADRLRADGVPRGFLRRIGGNARKIRATEEEADRWSVYLLARAGFPATAPADFWQRFGQDRGESLLMDATHPSWKERTATLRAIAAEVTADPRPLPLRDPRSATAPRVR